MLDATFTVVVLTGVVVACSAGLLALPWTDREVHQSVRAWSTLRTELARLGAALTSVSPTRPSAPLRISVQRAGVPARAVAVGMR